MAELTIYHNPRCSKSRATLAILRQRGTEPAVVDYQRTPPSVAELDTILERLGSEPLAITRTREKLFTELGLAESDDRPRSEWLAILHHHPKLIERPIVVHGDRAAIGRPPENVLVIL